MKNVNISNMKVQLSDHIQLVREGEEVFVCDRNKPGRDAAGGRDHARGGAMRKLLQLVFCLLLALPAWAGASVARSALILSTVNGTAFVDFGVAGVLTSNLGSQLTILDSSSHRLVGYIKAAGTRQTYGKQLLPNSTFQNITEVTAQRATLASVAGGQSGNCLQVTVTTSEGNGYELITTVAGEALAFSIYMKKGTETNYQYVSLLDTTYFHLLNWSGNVLPAAWRQYSFNATAATTGSVLYMTGHTLNDTSLFDTASLKQILTPSTTGVTITSTSGGTTYNWTSEDASFNPNDAKGYTYSFSK